MDTSKLTEYTARFNALFDKGAQVATDDANVTKSRKAYAHDLAVECIDAEQAVSMIRDMCSAKMTAFLRATREEPESDDWKVRKAVILNQCTEWRKACTPEGFTFGHWNRPKRAAVIDGTAKYEADVIPVAPKGSAGRTRGKAAETTATEPAATGEEATATIDVKNLPAMLNLIIGVHGRENILDAVLQRCGLTDGQAGTLVVALADNHYAMLKRLAAAAVKDASKGSKRAA